MRIIRKATVNDVEGICRIHRNCDDPWHLQEECASWVIHRLSRGFYIQVALVDDRVVGHGEWIISNEPTEKLLYLGMMQIDIDFQRQGIGSMMIDDALQYAAKQGCSYIATIPDDDPGVVDFYKKQGLLARRQIYRCNLTISAHLRRKQDSANILRIPCSVVEKLPFRLGLVQTSSQHMWEVCNRPPVTDNRLTPAFRTTQGDYVQLSYYESDRTALALCWSDTQIGCDLIEQILAFGKRLKLATIDFVFSEDSRPQFESIGENILNEATELVRPVG